MNDSFKRCLESLPTAACDEEYLHLARRWVLRILAGTEARQRYFRKRAENDAISVFLGYVPNGKERKEEEWNRWLDAALEEDKGKECPREGALFENIALLGKLVALNAIEQEVLAFRAMFRANEALYELMEQHFRVMSVAAIARVLGVALGRPRAEIETVLRPDGVLFKSGLLNLAEGIMPFERKVYATYGLVNALLRRNTSLDEFLSFAAHRAAEPGLVLKDFPHALQDIDVLMRFIASAAHAGQRGANVLIHGLPGVGKSELVRLLAKELGTRLYEVNIVEEGTGLALSPTARFASYRLNQRLLAQDRDVLVMFDEMEDVFPDFWQRLASHREQGLDKAWVNRLLEENPVPTFWIANEIEHMDRAYLRRFSYVFELRNPPRSVRRRIAGRYMAGLGVSDTWLESQLERDRLTPALIEQSARVVRDAQLTGLEAEKGFERIIRNHMQVLPGGDGPRYRMSDAYRLEYLNTNIDVVRFADTLAAKRRGRILLHGAPGTGKTALGHYLARMLDRPLLLRRASDLISMWVGQTEKNIAKMFGDAEAEDAVLLLDEADSFLRDRLQARHSWEVTQTNELLTQMEGFEGIFLCATNFLDHLDPASLRRFGLKVRFDYLTGEQRHAMFEEMLTAIGRAPEDELEQTRVRRLLTSLTNLAPGDFTAVRQRIDLLGSPVGAVDLAEALREESELKPDGRKRAIGFAG